MVVLEKVREIDGISTKELTESLNMDYTNIQRITNKLRELGLVGELYGTWTTKSEEATDGEFTDSGEIRCLVMAADKQVRKLPTSIGWAHYKNTTYKKA